MRMAAALIAASQCARGATMVSGAHEAAARAEVQRADQQAAGFSNSVGRALPAGGSTAAPRDFTNGTGAGMATQGGLRQLPLLPGRLRAVPRRLRQGPGGEPELCTSSCRHRLLTLEQVECWVPGCWLPLVMCHNLKASRFSLSAALEAAQPVFGSRVCGALSGLQAAGHQMRWEWPCCRPQAMP